MYNPKESKYSAIAELAEHLRFQEVEEFDIFFENMGFISRCSLQRGTRRSKLVDMLPLLVCTSVFRKRRRRRCR
jgi:hypothetical protein